MTFYVYILICADGTYYTGCTNNLKQRLHQHNHSPKAAHYTKIRRPVKLQYYQTYKTLKQARNRESQIKGWRREQKERLWAQPQL